MQKSRKLTCLILAICLVTSVLLLSCSTPAPAPAPSPTPAPSPKPTASPVPTSTPTPTAAPKPAPSPTSTKTFVLRMGVPHTGPDQGLPKFAFLPFAQAVNQRTNGRVKIDIYYADTLVPVRDFYEATAKGLLDISHNILSYSPGRFALAEGLLQLPLMFRSGEESVYAMKEMWKTGLLSGEFKETRMLGMETSSPHQVFFGKKKVMTPADMKGLRMRQPGGMFVELFKSWGAIPVALTASEIYPAMQTGTIDGSTFTLSSGQAFKFYEVSKYVIKLGLTVSAHANVMAPSTWDKLPADVQAIVMEEAEKMLYNISKVGYDDLDKESEKFFLGRGMEVYDPPNPTEWSIPAMGLYDQWVKDMTAKGLPGKEALEKFQAILKGLRK